MKRIESPPPGMSYPLGDILEAINMTPKQFAEYTKLHKLTIKRILNPDSHNLKVNSDTAAIIARSVGLKVNEIDWPHGISENGRKPQTGRKFYVHVKCRASAHFCEHHVREICPSCLLELPATGTCEFC